jgi:hypothetical protein
LENHNSHTPSRKPVVTNNFFAAIVRILISHRTHFGGFSDGGFQNQISRLFD